MFQCEECGGTVFLEGPHGGLAVNFACKHCRARYNDLWPFRIDRDGFATPQEIRGGVFFGDYTPREPLDPAPLPVSRPPTIE